MLIYYSIALLMCTSFFVPVLYADVTDFLRPEERREDYSEEPQPSGLLHETYTTREGETKRRFAPVERIFGTHRYEDDTARVKRRRATRRYYAE